MLLNRFLISILLCFSSHVFAGSPKISLQGKDEVDFGKYPAKNAKSKIFKIINNGDAPLKIKKVRNTCLCAVTGLVKKELNPGESSDLKITIKGDSIYGIYKKYVFIMTDDPENPIQKITVKGNAVPIAHLLPQRFAYAGEIKTGSKWEKTFFLTPTENGVEFEKAYTKDENCETKVNIARISDLKYRIKVELTPEIPKNKDPEAGKWEKPGFKCIVKIPIKHPEGWKSIEILIMGEIKE